MTIFPDFSFRLVAVRGLFHTSSLPRTDCTMCPASVGLQRPALILTQLQIWPMAAENNRTAVERVFDTTDSPTQSQLKGHGTKEVSLTAVISGGARL
jgi:hypothetical protein